MRQYAVPDKSKLLTSVLSSHKQRNTGYAHGSSTAFKDLRKQPNNASLYSSKGSASYASQTAVQKRGSQSQVQQTSQNTGRPQSGLAIMNQKNKIVAPSVQSDLNSKMRPFPRMETLEDNQNQNQQDNKQSKGNSHSMRSGSQTHLSVPKDQMTQSKIPKVSAYDSQRSSQANYKNLRNNRLASNDRRSTSRIGSGSRSLVKSASESNVFTFGNFNNSAVQKTQEGNVEYEKTPNKAMDQSNHKAKENQFNKLKSVMKNQNTKDYKLVKPPSSSQARKSVSKNMKGRKQSQKDLDNEDIERGSSFASLQVPVDGKQLSRIDKMNKGSIKDHRNDSGSALLGSMSSDFDRNQNPTPPAAVQETQKQAQTNFEQNKGINIIGGGVTKQDREDVPFPQSYPSLQPSFDPLEQKMQLSEPMITDGQGGNTNRNSSVRSSGRRPRNLRKQASKSSLSMHDQNYEQKQLDMSFEQNDNLQKQDDHSDNYNQGLFPQDRALRKKFSTSSSACPEPAEQEDVPRPSTDLQPLLPEESPRIISDIALKGVPMPEDFGGKIIPSKCKEESRPSNGPKRIQHKRSESFQQAGNQTCTISALLNQRINLSKSSIKNQWLDDLKLNQQKDLPTPTIPGPGDPPLLDASLVPAAIKEVMNNSSLSQSPLGVAQQPDYSDANKERLEQLDREILATRQSLLEADEKRQAISKQAEIADEERKKKMEAGDLTIDQEKVAGLEETYGQKDKIQQIIQKHTNAIGIDTIEESDATFEQTQLVNNKFFRKAQNHMNIQQDYSDQENLLLIYNNGKEMSKEDQHLFKICKQREESQKRENDNKSANKHNPITLKSDALFAKHQRSQSSLVTHMDKSRPPLSHRQNSALRTQQKHDSGQVQQKRVSTIQKSGEQSLRSARSCFSKKKDRNSSTKRSFQKSKVEPLISRPPGSKIKEEDIKTKIIPYQTLPDETIENDDDVHRFNTIEPPNNQEVLQTRASNLSYNKPAAQGPETARPVTSMQSLIKEYKMRTDYFKDFYHNVKSYTDFDQNKAYDEFLQRKADDDQNGTKDAVGRTSSVDLIERVRSKEDLNLIEKHQQIQPVLLKNDNNIRKTQTTKSPEKIAAKLPIPVPAVQSYVHDDNCSRQAAQAAVVQSFRASQSISNDTSSILDSKFEKESGTDTYRRKNSANQTQGKPAQPTQLARRRPVPQSNFMNKPGQQTIRQAYRASKKSFDFGYQGYQQVAKQKGSALQQTSDTKLDQEKQIKIDALNQEIQKAINNLDWPTKPLINLDQHQFKVVMKEMGFIKDGVAPDIYEQTENELKALYGHIQLKDRNKVDGKISTQAIQVNLANLCGIKIDQTNLSVKFQKLSKNRKQMEFERNVRQGIDEVNQTYDGSKFQPLQSMSETKPAKEVEKKVEPTSLSKTTTTDLGATRTKPPHQQHKTKTPDTSAHKSPLKTSEQSPPVKQVEEPVSFKSPREKEEDKSIISLNPCPEGSTPAQIFVNEPNELSNPYQIQMDNRRISIVDSDNTKYEFDMNSDSAQTAEQTEKQNKSEQLLEKLASNKIDKKPETPDPYSFDKMDALKRSGQLKQVQNPIIQQDTSPTRTYKTDKNTSSQVQLVSESLQDQKLNQAINIQNILDQQSKQKMRIGYDISQLGNALIETSLKALSSPQGQGQRAKPSQVQRQLDGPIGLSQPKSAQMIETDDKNQIQMPIQTAANRAQSSSQIDGNSPVFRQEDELSASKLKAQDTGMLNQNQQSSAGQSPPLTLEQIQDRSFKMAPTISIKSPQAFDRMASPRVLNISQQSSQDPTPKNQEQVLKPHEYSERPPKILDVSETELDNEEETVVEDPILILDIKLVKDEPQKITIYEFDNPEDIVDQFCVKHNLDHVKRERLLTVIKAQIQEYYAENNLQEDDQTNSQNNTADIDERNAMNESRLGDDAMMVPEARQLPEAAFLGQIVPQHPDLKDQVLAGSPDASDGQQNVAEDREDALTQIDENLNETENTIDEETLN